MGSRASDDRSGGRGGAVPRSLVEPAKRAARRFTDLLPTDVAVATRRVARYARLERARPSSRPATSARTSKLDLLRALWNSYQATPDLAVVDDPGSDHACCPLCGSVVDAFLAFGVKAARAERQCPGCGSLERHRLVWLYFTLHTDLFDGSPRRLLHLAPEPAMRERFRRLRGVEYLTGDLEPGKAMVQMDVTAIDRPDASFDVIYVSHVLEHVPDDLRAMSELHRVLAPDGWAILEVPILGPTTREDPSVTDPAERTRLFGQSDHVRQYGRDGVYEERLRAAGFDLTVVDLAAELGPGAVRRYRLDPTERVYVCRR